MLRWRRETLHACLNTSHPMQPTSVFCPTPDCHSARQGQDSVTAGPALHAVPAAAPVPTVQFSPNDHISRPLRAFRCHEL